MKMADPSLDLVRAVKVALIDEQGTVMTSSAALPLSDAGVDATALSEAIEGVLARSGVHVGGDAFEHMGRMGRNGGHASAGLEQDVGKEIYQAEKMAIIGQMAAGVAHEINNPVGYVYTNLNILRAYVDDVVQLLEVMKDVEKLAPSGTEIANLMKDLHRRIDMPSLQDDLVNIVQESADGMIRVKEIIQALKDFSHQGEEKYVDYDVHVGIETMLRIASNEIKYKASIRKDYGDLPLVECIPLQVNQIILNLLVNAAQAIEERGEIAIRTGTDGEAMVWVEIEDSGVGISAENIDKLFKPFFTTKPAGKGTGLGLSLSRSIAEQHGGDLSVTSVKGRGACFRLVLPIHR